MSLQPTRLVHPMLFLAAPQIGASTIGLLVANEPLLVQSAHDGFLLVRRADGRDGFVPSAACVPSAIPAVENGLKETFVSQPVALYFKPTAGSQFVPDLNDTAYQWMILPDEPLGVLGVEQNFVLVQRPNGQIGFVPKMLCKDVQLFAPTKTDKVLGAIGWAILGVGWAFWNWLGLFGVLQGLTFLEQSARAFVGIGVILAAMIVLWLSPRKLMARSFAVGIVICYGWMHLLSWGWLTLWQG